MAMNLIAGWWEPRKASEHSHPVGGRLRMINVFSLQGYPVEHSGMVETFHLYAAQGSLGTRS